MGGAVRSSQDVSCKYYTDTITVANCEQCSVDVLWVVGLSFQHYGIVGPSRHLANVMSRVYARLCRTCSVRTVII